MTSTDVWSRDMGRWEAQENKSEIAEECYDGCAGL